MEEKKSEKIQSLGGKARWVKVPKEERSKIMRNLRMAAIKKRKNEAKHPSTA